MEEQIILNEKYHLKQDKIYKYVSLYSAEIIISTSTLRFTNPKDFNDPFDCDENILEYNMSEKGIDVDTDIDKVSQNFYKDNEKELKEKNITLNKLKGLIRESPGIINAYKKSKQNDINESSVCCFSKTYKNILMWSHYSDKHKGVCLEFDLSTVGIDNIFLGKTIDIIGQVDYDRKDKINYLKDKVEAVAKLFLSKAKDWEYEKEVRMLLRNEKGLVQFNKSFLSGVVFGCRASDLEIDEIKILCDKHGYKNLIFKKAKKEDFELGFETIYASTKP